MFKIGRTKYCKSKESFFNIVIGFGIISFIITSNLLYLIVINNSIRNLEQYSISKNYLTLICDKNDISWDMLNRVKNLEGVNSIQVSADDSLSSYTKKNNKDAKVSGYIPIEESCLLIGDNLYYGKSINDVSLEKNALTFQEMILRCDVSFMVENYSKISLNELQEYKNKFGKDESPFLYGNEPNFENEIAVSDYFLNRYNISKESFKSLIGSNITIYHVSPDGLTQPTLKGVKLTGIIDSRFFTISSRKNTPQVLVTLSEDFPFDKYRIKIFLDSYDSVEEKKEKVENTLMMSVNYDSSNLITRKNLYMQKNVIFLIFTLVFTVLVIAGVVYVFNIYLYYFFERKYYIGMTKAIGLSDKSLVRILLFELFIPNFTSLLFGGAISFLTVNFFLGKVYPVIGTEYTIKMIDILKALSLTFCINTAISLLLVFSIKAYINRSSILSLMQ